MRIVPPRSSAATTRVDPAESAVDKFAQYAFEHCRTFPKNVEMNSFGHATLMALDTVRRLRLVIPRWSYSENSSQPPVGQSPAPQVAALDERGRSVTLLVDWSVLRPGAELLR